MLIIAQDSLMHEYVCVYIIALPIYPDMHIHHINKITHAHADCAYTLIITNHTCTCRLRIHIHSYSQNHARTCRLLQQLHERHHSGQQMVRTANEMKKVVEALERLNDYMLGHIRYEEEVTMPWLRKVDTTSAIAV
jgi:hypothetical protein